MDENEKIAAAEPAAPDTLKYDGLGSANPEEDIVDRAGTVMTLWMALFIICWTSAEKFEMPNHTALFVSASFCFSAILFGYYYIVPFGVSRGVIIGAAVFAAGAAFLRYAKVVPFPVAVMITDISLCTLAFALGRKLADLLDSPKFIFPVAIVMFFADIWSVAAGLTKALAKKPDVINYVLVSFPLLGTPKIVPMIGMVDFLFLAMFLGVAYRFGMPVLGNAVVLLLGGIACFLVATSIGLGLPMLPFFAVSFCAYNWRRIKPGEEELKTTAIFLFLMAAAFTVIYFVKK